MSESSGEGVFDKSANVCTKTQYTAVYYKFKPNPIALFLEPAEAKSFVKHYMNAEARVELVDECLSDLTMEEQQVIIKALENYATTSEEAKKVVAPLLPKLKIGDYVAGDSDAGDRKVD